MLQAALDDCNAAVRLSTGKRHKEALRLRAQIQTCLQNHEVSWLLCAVVTCFLGANAEPEPSWASDGVCVASPPRSMNIRRSSGFVIRA